jgi:hypothetical protein
MRIWRFDRNGVKKDAAMYDDTFVLTNFDSSDWYIGICLEYPDSSDVREKAIKFFVNDAERKGYDYVCIYQGKIFPIKDCYTRNLQDLIDAMYDAQNCNFCWNYFKRG